jgi:hypothetical protein
VAEPTDIAVRAPLATRRRRLEEGRYGSLGDLAEAEKIGGPS